MVLRPVAVPTRTIAVAAAAALILAIVGLAACRGTAATSNGDTPDAGGDAGACIRVMPRTEAGTCPVVPPGGVVCDFTEIASGWCHAPDCPASEGCCAYGVPNGQSETCSTSVVRATRRCLERSPASRKGIA